MAGEIIFENIYSLVMDHSALNIPFTVQLLWQLYLTSSITASDAGSSIHFVRKMYMLSTFSQPLLVRDGIVDVDTYILY